MQESMFDCGFDSGYKTAREEFIAQSHKDMEYTPEALRAFAHDVTALRKLVLCCDCDGADPFSENFLFLALSALDQARHYFTLASMQQSKALTGA